VLAADQVSWTVGVVLPCSILSARSGRVVVAVRDCSLPHPWKAEYTAVPAQGPGSALIRSVLRHGEVVEHHDAPIERPDSRGRARSVPTGGEPPYALANGQGGEHPVVLTAHAETDRSRDDAGPRISTRATVSAVSCPPRIPPGLPAGSGRSPASHLWMMARRACTPSSISRCSADRSQARSTSSSVGSSARSSLRDLQHVTRPSQCTLPLGRPACSRPRRRFELRCRLQDREQLNLDGKCGASTSPATVEQSGRDVQLPPISGPWWPYRGRTGRRC
jgi:hypothetical protein